MRNLGKPVELAGRYFEEGADEVTFLNITGGHRARHAVMGGLPAARAGRPAGPTSPPGCMRAPLCLVSGPLARVWCHRRCFVLAPTGFRDFPLGDLPMLEVLRQASEGVFVPLTVGGGIREFTDGTGKHYSALQVAAEYFR